MTLVLVFRHLCSELRSDKLERQNNQALFLWTQLNPPASLLPFRWYSCDTTHRGWRLLQRNSKYFASFLHLLLAESITSTHGMSSSTITYDHHLHVDTTPIA